MCWPTLTRTTHFIVLTYNTFQCQWQCKGGPFHTWHLLAPLSMTLTDLRMPRHLGSCSPVGDPILTTLSGQIFPNNCQWPLYMIASLAHSIIQCWPFPQSYICWFDDISVFCLVCFLYINIYIYIYIYFAWKSPGNEFFLFPNYLQMFCLWIHSSYHLVWLLFWSFAQFMAYF